MTISILLFAVCILSLLQSGIFKRDFFAPLNVYIFSQALSLGIAYLKLMPQMSDFQTTTWLVVIGSAISFAAGVFTLRLIWAARHPHEAIDRSAPSHALLAEANSGYRWWLHALMLIFAFLYLGIGLWAEWKEIGTLILFSPNINRLMTIEGMPSLGWFVFPLNSGPLVAMLAAPGAFSSLNPHRKLRWFFRISFLLGLFLGFAGMPNRISIFSAALVMLYTFNLSARRIRPSFIVLGLLLSLVAFMAVAGTKGQSAGVSRVMFQKEVLMLPYSYIANNWWNLDYAINRPVDQPEHTRLYGLDMLHGVMMPNPTFGSLYSAFKWDGIFNETAAKVPRLNSITYHWSLYKDFGLIGAVGFPFFFGFLFNYLYLKTKTRGRVFDLSLYTYFLFWVTLWFFEEFWSNSLYISWLFFIAFTTLISKPPRGKEVN